ncbi:AHH domain-containing protein [Roseivirga echinicomitans]
MNITSRSQRAHHIIPWRFNEHPVIQAAAKSAKGWHPNDILNGAAVAKARHNGSHEVYDTYVNSRLQSFISAQNGNIDPDMAYNFLKSLAEEINLKIISNPTKLINELY